MSAIPLIHPVFVETVSIVSLQQSTGILGEPCRVLTNDMFFFSWVLSRTFKPFNTTCIFIANNSVRLNNVLHNKKTLNFLHHSNTVCLY